MSDTVFPAGKRDLIGESDIHSWAMNFTVSCARAAGHDVRIANSLKLLFVNDKVCSFQHMTYCYRNKDAQRSYTKTMISRKVIRFVDAGIFCSVVRGFAPHIFVIPSQVLEVAFPDPSKGQTTLWFPVERLPAYGKHHSRIPFWDYENAWPPRERVRKKRQASKPDLVSA